MKFRKLMFFLLIIRSSPALCFPEQSDTLFDTARSVVADTIRAVRVDSVAGYGVLESEPPKPEKSVRLNDSLDYIILYNGYFTLYGNDESYSLFFKTAQDFADQKLFKEAQGILKDFFSGSESLEHTSADRRNAEKKAKTADYKWRISLYGSHNNSKDIFVNTFLSDTVDTFYYSSWLGSSKVKMEWDFFNSALNKLVPWVSIFNTRGSFGSEFQGAFFNDRIALNGEIYARSRIDTGFNDPNASVSGDVAAQTSWRWDVQRVKTIPSLRVRLQQEKYRRNGYMYVSFWEPSVTPGIQLESRDLTKTLSTNFTYAFRDYEFVPDSVSYKRDWHRFGPDFNLFLWRNKISSTVMASYQWELQPYWAKKKAVDPWKRETLYSDLWLTYIPVGWLTASTTMELQLNRDYYPFFHVKLDSFDIYAIKTVRYDDSVKADGNAVRLVLKPQVMFNVSNRFSAGLAYSYEKNSLAMHAARHVDSIINRQPYRISNASAPAFLINFNRTTVRIDCTAEYLIERVEKGFFDFDVSKRGFVVSWYASWYPLKRFAVRNNTSYKYLTIVDGNLPKNDFYSSVSIDLEL